MLIKKIFITLFLVIITSFYFFPISFVFLPEGLNTKMVMAVLGACFWGYDCVRLRGLSISRVVCISTVLAILFSIWCMFCIAENATSDTSYSRYWLSFLTWLGGAYGVCILIKKVTGRLDLEQITYYLSLVCVVQGILALMIDNSYSIQTFVNRYVVQGQEYVQKVHRLYGVGASLDTAGVRFSTVLLLIAHQLSTRGQALKSVDKTVFYFMSYAVIVVVGSIISRTTWVGAIAGVLYMALMNLHSERGFVSRRQITFWSMLVAIVLMTILVTSYLYRHNPGFHANLRFGFEGFFNWAETGVFRTDSTDKLNRVMWVWPKVTRSWIIGTGLFDDWVYGTDIGYCRFTLYCGLVGMVLFSIFFIYNGIALNYKLDNVALLSVFLIALTFIIWLKVSTDIFFIYALLFCLDAGKEADSDTSICTSSTT